MGNMEKITECIRNHKNIPTSIEITDDMRTTLNEEGYTQCQWWIINMMSDPPSYLRHAPEIQDRYGNTAYMVWLKILHFEPPNWMRHDANIRNYLNETAETVWCKYTTYPLPRYLKCNEIEVKKHDDSDAFINGADLTYKEQASILLNNEIKLNARLAHKLYLIFCRKYNISNPMSEIILHRYLMKLCYRKEEDDEGIVFYCR